MNHSHHRSIVIEGRIIVADQDRYGKILEIALETDRFELYLFTDSPNGRKLLACLNQKVHIECDLMGLDFCGRTLINVNSFYVCDAATSE